MRRSAQTGVDNEHRIRQAAAQNLQRVRIHGSAAAADGCSPGHYGGAARIVQTLRHHQIFGGVSKHRKPFARQHGGGLQGGRSVGLQRFVVANDFQLDPVRTNHLARHLRQRDRVFRAVAARRVGQDMAAQRLDFLPEAVAATAFGLQAAQPHGQHLGAAGAHRVGQNLR